MIILHLHVKGLSPPPLVGPPVQCLIRDFDGTVLLCGFYVRPESHLVLIGQEQPWL